MLSHWLVWVGWRRSENKTFVCFECPLYIKRSAIDTVPMLLGTRPLNKVRVDHACVMWTDNNPDVNILIETFKNGHQAVNSKTVELNPADA